MADHTPPSIDKTRNIAESIDNHEPHKTDKMKTMGEKEYFRAAFPEGYGLDKKVNQEHKIEASGANLNLFNHRKAGYFSIIPEAVKEAGLSPDSKGTLMRFAHSAWEIRAENTEDGQVRNYFVLREDIDLSKNADTLT